MLLLNSARPSRLRGASRCSLPCTLISTLLASIATRTPTAPATSMRAPSRTLLRLASTSTWPPVASVSESPRNSTSPPLAMRTSDWSRRCATPSPALSESLIIALRCTSSAVVALSSSRIAVTLPVSSVTLPAASAVSLSRCTVPRVWTEVVDTATPCWRTSRPVSVMSPCSACSSPVLRTSPAALPSRRSGVMVLPRVVEAWFSSVPRPLRITKASPAASMTWPLGVLIWPWLCASRPASST